MNSLMMAKIKISHLTNMLAVGQDPQASYDSEMKIAGDITDGQLYC